jgi:Fe-S cluster biogenesis protein NfuA/nitrite reductase/ring-hydroxylating ferredoxin subunit
MPHRPDNPEEDAQWRNAGDRIQNLLDASAAGGVVAHERAEQLVREVTDLYGGALERMLGMAVTANPELLDAFAADDLIASLLLVHGLHPHTVERRIEEALESVRPYLGSHGGDVHLLEVAGEVVRLQFAGSCKSCPSSAVTLELAVEDAVRAAAPEISSIEVVAAEASESTSAVIPADSLMSRVRTQPHGHVWHPVPGVADLAAGEVGGFAIAGTTVLACRVGDRLFAYHDRCGSCGDSLAGAMLHRALGTDGALLRCPRCGAHFDVVHAGACVDGNGSAEAHLEPIPLLERDGVLSMAVAEAVAS